jgi:hypothetical protein
MLLGVVVLQSYGVLFVYVHVVAHLKAQVAKF